MADKSNELNRHDLQVFQLVAEYQVLTLVQLSALLSRNPKALSRRLVQLESAGLIRKTSRGFGRGRGRPESIFSLTDAGLEKLVAEGAVGSGTAQAKVTDLDTLFLDHQLLVNWFRVNLVQLERLVPRLSVRFLSPNSPFLGKDSEGKPLIYDRVTLTDDTAGQIDFIPDGVFMIKDTMSEQGKALLFFLEVDMDTEPLVSANNPSKDIRQKILCYQSYFRSQGYKRYEPVWNCSLTGFRLLFLTNTSARRTALCRLVQEMQPSDFIWVADQESMFAKGLGARIWARGGKDHRPPESVLGKLATHQTALSSL